MIKTDKSGSFPTPAARELEPRQAGAGAALGGGPGKPTTQEEMEHIKGYTPPSTISDPLPEPKNFKKGSILNKSDIEGYQAAARLTNTADFVSPSMIFALFLAVAAGAALL